MEKGPKFSSHGSTLGSCRIDQAASFTIINNKQATENVIKCHDWYDEVGHNCSHQLFLLSFYQIILCYLILITRVCIGVLIGTLRLQNSFWLTCQSVVRALALTVG